MNDHDHTEFVPCCFRCERARDEVPPSLTLRGDDTLMWVVDGVPVATAARDEVLVALGVGTDDLERFRSHLEWDCCQWISGNQVMVDKDLHDAMWRVLGALTGWSDDE